MANNKQHDNRGISAHDQEQLKRIQSRAQRMGAGGRPGVTASQRPGVSATGYESNDTTGHVSHKNR